MVELIEQLRGIARGMWRWRWWGLVVAWIVACIGVAVVMRIPDRYEASARVYVNTASILRPLMSGLAIQPNVEQQVAMLSRTLISRPNMEKLVRMADLDLKLQSKADSDALVDELLQTVRISSAQSGNLYVLSYQSPDREKARRVIQSAVSMFVESSLGSNRKDTDSAKAFIDEQIKAYEAKLQEAESKLKEFRLRNIEMQTADGKDGAGQLSELAAHLNQARLELREAETARDAAKAQLEGRRTSLADLAAQSMLQDSAPGLATPEIDARIEAQKRELDLLLRRFTEAHPEVQITQRLIRDLEEQKRKQVAELRLAAASAPAAASVQDGGSLAQQELSRMVASAEVQVAALRARVAEYGARYEHARQRLKTSPQLEAEAAQLNRDYAIHKQNYDSLVGRRESATMSGELEEATSADFKLIDPPRVSPKPVAPNRPLLLPLPLLAALAAGLFVAFVASQLRPVFHQGSELRDRLGLPLLGVVSLVASDADRRRERMGLVRFVAASGSLVGLFMVGMVALAIMAAR